MVYRVVDILVLLVALSQWLYILLSGDSNASLSRFADALGRYVAQIIQYLGYHTEHKPFPFNDWPGRTTQAQPVPDNHEDAVR
jgi:hypothetical protein